MPRMRLGGQIMVNGPLHNMGCGIWHDVNRLLKGLPDRIQRQISFRTMQKFIVNGTPIQFGLVRHIGTLQEPMPGGSGRLLQVAVFPPARPGEEVLMTLSHFYSVLLDGEDYPWIKYFLPVGDWPATLHEARSATWIRPSDGDDGGGVLVDA